MVYRVYVEKKAPFAQEAAALFRDIRSFLQIEQLEGVRILNRYDVENIDRALVKLAGQGLGGEHRALKPGQSKIHVVQLRLGKYRADGGLQ